MRSLVAALSLSAAGCSLADLTGGSPCDGLSLCEQFDGQGSPSGGAATEVRTVGDVALTQEQGYLRSTVNTGMDCTYSDIVYQLTLAGGAFEVRTRLKRVTDDESFFLTVNHGQGNKSCLELLTGRVSDLRLQTNAGGTGLTTTDNVPLPFSLGEWHEVSLRVEPLATGGVTLTAEVDGTPSTVTRPDCGVSAEVTVSLGHFCTAGVGTLLYDYLMVGDLK